MRVDQWKCFSLNTGWGDRNVFNFWDVVMQPKKYARVCILCTCALYSEPLKCNSTADLEHEAFEWLGVRCDEVCAVLRGQRLGGCVLAGKLMVSTVPGCSDLEGSKCYQYSCQHFIYLFFRGFVFFIFQNSLFPQFILVHRHEDRVLLPCTLYCYWSPGVRVAACQSRSW